MMKKPQATQSPTKQSLAPKNKIVLDKAKSQCSADSDSSGYISMKMSMCSLEPKSNLDG